MPGFGELFRMLSYEQVGAAAMSSRATAGVYRGKLVFSTPGSNAAVRLAWEKLIAPELQHSRLGGGSMSAIECQSANPHAHHGVPGGDWIGAVLARLRSEGNLASPNRGPPHSPGSPRERRRLPLKS